MGRQDVSTNQDPAEFRAFTKALLTDLRALEQMIREGRIESGVRRIGAEQEMFLVDRAWRPAPIADEVLANLGPEFTTEIALFNLEANLPPYVLGGTCFSELHVMLNDMLGKVQLEAHKHRAEVVLTGILPTLAKSDLSLQNMTPRERYRALNTAINQMSGGVYRVQIQGADELNFERHRCRPASSQFPGFLRGINTDDAIDLFGVVIRKIQSGANAVLAASIFHDNMISVTDLKRKLVSKEVSIRL